jgi:hypothetical protein
VERRRQGKQQPLLLEDVDSTRRHASPVSQSLDPYAKPFTGIAAPYETGVQGVQRLVRHGGAGRQDRLPQQLAAVDAVEDALRAGRFEPIVALGFERQGGQRRIEGGVKGASPGCFVHGAGLFLFTMRCGLPDAAHSL